MYFGRFCYIKLDFWLETSAFTIFRSPLFFSATRPAWDFKIQIPLNNTLCFFIAQSVQDASSSRRLHMGLKKVPHRQTDTAEPLRNSPPETSSKRTISNTAPQGAAELQCPRCLTTYDDEHATEYLNHWDECAKLWVSHLTDFSQGTESTEDRITTSLQTMGCLTGCWWRQGYV